MKKTKICKKCKKEIDKNTKICPYCNTKQKNNIRFIILIVLSIFIIIIYLNDKDNENNIINNIIFKNKITVKDFSTMTKAEVDTWCQNNNIKCTIENKYSNTIDKNQFISQSINANEEILENDEITIVFSLGKKITTEREAALEKAKDYSEQFHMSKQNIYNQLISQIEGFNEEDAKYAINNLITDYKNNALEKAKEYQKNSNMSKSAIYNQLISNVENFTIEEAQYAINKLK